MTPEELKKGEYDTVEYKQDIPKDRDKCLKTAVAFANDAGGSIIFGVENDTWNVIGFSDDEVFQKYDAIENCIYDVCMPSVVLTMTRGVGGCRNSSRNAIAWNDGTLKESQSVKKSTVFAKSGTLRSAQSANLTDNDAMMCKLYHE